MIESKESLLYTTSPFIVSGMLNFYCIRHETLTCFCVHVKQTSDAIPTSVELHRKIRKQTSTAEADLPNIIIVVFIFTVMQEALFWLCRTCQGVLMVQTLYSCCT